MAGTLGAGDKAIFMAVVVSQLKVSLAEMTKRDLTAGAVSEELARAARAGEAGTVSGHVPSRGCELVTRWACPLSSPVICTS